MSTFQEIAKSNNIKQTIKETFDVDLLISGDWGYSEAQATVLEGVENAMPLSQLEHMLTTIRAHLEMNITQKEDNRYGGINANEKAREQISRGTSTVDKVTYEISAIKENLYNAFIKEYKAGYDNGELDLNDHFKRRKEATLIREIIHYFEVSSVQ